MRAQERLLCAAMQAHLRDGVPRAEDAVCVINVGELVGLVIKVPRDVVGAVGVAAAGAL